MEMKLVSLFQTCHINFWINTQGPVWCIKKRSLVNQRNRPFFCDWNVFSIRNNKTFFFFQKEAATTTFPVQSFMTNCTGQYRSYASFLYGSARTLRCNLRHQTHTITRTSVRWNNKYLAFSFLTLRKISRTPKSPSPLLASTSFPHHFLMHQCWWFLSLMCPFLRVQFEPDRCSRWKNTAIFLFLWHY